ncbi:MAG: hypothetical protein M0R22_13800 [Dehalococcoidia bacterium]|nr:hypothetical protein [Dehalococcoidia bacterium]
MATLDSTNKTPQGRRRTWTNAGVPSNGAAGTLYNRAEPGDLLIDTTNKTLYQNTNTQASPTWTQKAASGAALDTDVANMAAAGTSTANTLGAGTTAAPINHVHALGTHDHSGATKGGDLGAVTIASGAVTGALTVGGDLDVTGTITGTIATASWATPTFTGVTTFNGLSTFNANVTFGAEETLTLTGKADTTIITLTLGDMVVTDGALSITNAGDTTAILTLDNSSGNIASGAGILTIDAGGNTESGGSMIRLAPTGTPVEGSVGLQFVGAGKVMQALNIDGDSVTNSLCLINGGGNIADNMGVLKVTGDGTIANGGAIVNITGSTAASATAYGLIINCNANNLEGLSVEAGLVKFAERVDHADGAAATPSISFSSDTDTGLFWAATYIGAAVGGGLIAQIAATGVTLNTDLDLTLQGAGYITLGATGYVAIGTNPAGAGVVRLANAAAIDWRNAANNADITALAVNAADDLDVGADLQMQGNTVYGNDAENGNLILSSTLHATKGFVGIATGEQGFKLGGTADRAGTVGDNGLDIFNGAAAPAGTLANGITLYSEGGECKVLDAAGNSTTLSPHTNDGDYVIHSFSAVKGETVTIHLEKLAKELAKDPKYAAFVDVGAGHVKKPKSVEV